MEVVSSGHVDVENEILDPYCRIGCAVVCFDIDGLEPLGEFVIQYFICEAEGVCGASISGQVTMQLGWSLSAVFGPDVVMLLTPSWRAVLAHQGMPPRSVDRSGLTCSIL